ncbi:MAG: hypothetical protein QG608_889 [Actinomycetota bacterium]|nr:hypothetical protein [Actinomycetota bacterium]
MRLDHVSYAAEEDGLRETAARLAAVIGVEPVDVGVHPRYGTRNVVLPLAGEHYIEVLEMLDHPVAERVPFGRAVRERTRTGGGWFGWVVAVDDLDPVERRLGREPLPGNRRRADGTELRWRQIGVNGLGVDPLLPFVRQWEVATWLRPSAGAEPPVRLASLRLAGDPARVCGWLGRPASSPLHDVDIEWVAPRGAPGVLSVRFETPTGPVII